MDQLRWILIGLGLLILAGIYLFANPERKNRQASRQPNHKKTPSIKQKVDQPNTSKRVSESTRRIEPTIGDTSLNGQTERVPAQQQMEVGLPPGEQPSKTSEVKVDSDNQQGQAADLNQSSSRVRVKASSAPPVPTMSLYVVSDDQLITGVELLDAAVKVGLRFGEHDIFHRLQEGSDVPLFSMANLTQPGTFDKDGWNLFETRGVTLFMSMDGPQNTTQSRASDAWDSMLATADRLAGLLGARIIDNQRQPLTRQRIGEIREQARQFDRENV